MPNRDPPGCYEFFAGGGLAGLGLTGFRTLFANDLDPMKARAWHDNHPEAELHLGDVWDLTPADLPGRADLAWASSPCQDLSLAGARGGLEARRSGAFWGFWALMRGLIADGRAPGVIVIENVCGLLSSGKGADFTAVCSALVEAGYRVGALEIDAALWLPQSRPRLFIVATRDAGLDKGAAGGPFHTPRLMAAEARLPQAVRDAWVWWRLTPQPRRNHDLAALLEPDDAVHWFNDAETRALSDLMAPLHQARLAQILASGERRVGAAYRRVRAEAGGKAQRLEVRFDGLAGCLRTPAGGSSRQYVVLCEEGRVRMRRLTGREAARLMGVGDDYRLPSSESAALKLMGDAVAVPVVRALAEQLLHPLLGLGAKAAA